MRRSLSRLVLTISSSYRLPQLVRELPQLMKGDFPCCPIFACACGAISSLIAMCSSAVAGESPAIRVRFPWRSGRRFPGYDQGLGQDHRWRHQAADPGGVGARARLCGEVLSGPEKLSKMPYAGNAVRRAGAYVLRFVTPLTTSGPDAHKDNVCIDAGASGYETRPLYVRGNVSRDAPRSYRGGSCA